MRASNPHNPHSRCPRCLLSRKICICPMVPQVQTQAEFLIVRHIREAERPSNTGRLAALALPNSRIISCGGGTRIGMQPLDDEGLQKPGTWLLWPDGPALQPKATELAPPDRVVVLDATWRQSRRLFSRTPALQALPRLALAAPPPGRNRLREQHRPDGMSTLEAVAAAVAQLEGTEAAEPLERLYDEVVRRTTDLRWGIKTFF